MARRSRLAALVIIGLPVLAACGLIPPVVECGPLPPGDCEQRARVITAEGQRGDPTRRIVRITFTDERGSYSAEYDDGTGTRLVVD